jgi:transketolase
VDKGIEWHAVNVIRGLAIDGVERAKSGHPGLPLGAAPMAYVLWARHLVHDPSSPRWPDRDRFVLSAGHGSMLLYSLLHLSGYELSLDDLEHFRQWGSRTPGHPEYGLTPGVETTTGPLGQGVGNAVGMALAERWLAATFNRPGHEIVDHRTWAIAGDGDLMEGVSSEAASLAGHLGLGRLTVLYDSNRISIDGSTDLAFTEDVALRFQAYGWHVGHADGNDLESVDDAIRTANAESQRPSLIVVRTNIGFGSPHKQDTAAAHGAPLGPEETALTKERLGLPPDRAFDVPADVRAHMEETTTRGRDAHAAWHERLARYAEAYPDLAAIFERAQHGELPDGWTEALPTFESGKKYATRAASGMTLNALAPAIPNLIGGSADLMESNNADIKGSGSVQHGAWAERVLHFGVREHGMGATLNGLSLHGGIRPFGGTFLIFSDYMRPAIRLASLMEQPVIYLFTHDSVGLGEDGPTHQPVEQTMSLRLIPGLEVIRPADAPETAMAWRLALERGNGPTALVLTRQKLPVLDRAPTGPLANADGLLKGGYILAEAERSGLATPPDVVLVGTGSEVHLCLAARELLAAEGIAARVVSMPSPGLFGTQPANYREAVLPAAVRARVVVEAGATRGWEGVAGPCGRVLGIDHFGASAPGGEVMRQFGFTPENVAELARASIADAASLAT